jgi:hypothetical protein
VVCRQVSDEAGHLLVAEPANVTRAALDPGVENLHCSGAFGTDSSHECHAVSDGHARFGGDVLAQIAFGQKAFQERRHRLASAGTLAVCDRLAGDGQRHRENATAFAEGVHCVVGELQPIAKAAGFAEPRDVHSIEPHVQLPRGHQGPPTA